MVLPLCHRGSLTCALLGWQAAGYSVAFSSCAHANSLLCCAVLRYAVPRCTWLMVQESAGPEVRCAADAQRL